MTRNELSHGIALEAERSENRRSVSSRRLISALALQRTAFSIGDLTLILTVAIAGSRAMQLAHEIGLPLAGEILLGMLASMLVQLLLATLAAPILGSIESMVPTAVIAMALPAIVCLLSLLGLGWRRSQLDAATAIIATVFWLWTLAYAHRCRRRFRTLAVARPCATPGTTSLEPLGHE